ncbi:carbon-monoxide dehydrogenase small subunit [Neorhizobium galegae]|uniref:(2Fe-2S)-binding protein n=1 Tax=Neorhizobium galegae TaxID=399 RepID=UPI00277D3BD8|nr:(2Fe-2S)-binding protein [Neorhizobium galegae]MDQ0137730.1 carbon-monoxide dehydrogenase small subunit [Neorhizobium galegae]
MTMIEVTMTVNGQTYSRSVEPRLLLSDFLRQDLGLIGTHVGCEHGVCGACTVLMDGRSIRSCLTFAIQAEGSTLETIEGLAAKDGTLSPLQQSFQDCHGLQCGFCTPGFLMRATELLRNGEAMADREDIREAISGNLCRCTGYETIVDAIEAAACQMRGVSR